MTHNNNNISKYPSFIVIIFFSLLFHVDLFVYGQPSCSQPFIAPDGSTYSLVQLMQAGILNSPQTGPDGTPYVYNITVCGNQPNPCNNANCAGPYTAGICQTWKDGSGFHARCFGRFDRTAIVSPLSDNTGVKIIYDNGDSCGSCLPAGPRSTVLTILCGGSSLWDPLIVVGGAPNIPAISYINGTSNSLCVENPAPVSTPTMTPLSTPTMTPSSTPIMTPSSAPSSTDEDSKIIIILSFSIVALAIAIILLAVVIILAVFKIRRNYEELQ